MGNQSMLSMLVQSHSVIYISTKAQACYRFLDSGQQVFLTSLAAAWMLGIAFLAKPIAIPLRMADLGAQLLQPGFR